MRLGLQIPSFTWPGGPAEIAPRLGEIARAADEFGLASLWVMDHFFQIPSVGPAEREMLEGWTTLAFLAAHTRRISLGTLVTGVTYRHPGVLVKTATTLDVLSGGRAILGIGAAWYEREHRGLGVPFPPRAERFERLEDALRIAKQMWSGRTAAFQGRHHRLAETLCAPLPLARPHPPILIGGIGERKTLRLVARYADAWNAFDAIGVKELSRKRDVLLAHCDVEGRDAASIECTTLGALDLDAAPLPQLVRHFRRLAAAGFSHAIVSLPDPVSAAAVERVGRELLPEIAGL
jgi:F420-dependent oxidoreductase-like protein